MNHLLTYTSDGIAIWSFDISVRSTTSIGEPWPPQIEQYHNKSDSSEGALLRTIKCDSVKAPMFPNLVWLPEGEGENFVRCSLPMS